MAPSALSAGGDAHRQRILAASSVQHVATQLMVCAADFTDVEKYLALSLPIVRTATGAGWVGIVEPQRGQWTTWAESGSGSAPPTDLLADVLDRDEAREGEDWQVAPLVERRSGQRLLVVHAPRTNLACTDSLAATLGAAIQRIGVRYRDHRRIRRLETMLEIANQWNKTRKTEPLLVQMAEAATQLIGADRASIFLWDRPNKMLVGRPALGVEGNELRIAENTGIVGQVIQSGQPRRVARKEAEELIDRTVDQQLGYSTETLLCVPLRGSGGELFGAFEMINKLEGDFTDEDEAGLIELAAHAATALENTQELETLVDANQRLVDEAAGAIKMIGSSPAIEAIRSTVSRVADTDLAVLIFGENGTGKEVASQLIHYLSSRREQPFVAVNCAAIPDTLLESELFGHEKGAFTDARETRIGKFEQAAKGTLFLDEIGDLSLSGQSKLLRVLEEKIVVRVGGSTPIHTDARILAATNQNLTELVGQKKFREDLYFRLNVVSLELPSLRDRGEDVHELADYFLKELSRKAGRKVPKFTAAARKRLRSHSWPGNIRELRNLMERLVYLTTSEKIEASELEFILSPAKGASAGVADDQPLADATTQFQQQYIARAIERSGSNMSEAASRLGLHRSNLYRKMRQLGMSDTEDT